MDQPEAKGMPTQQAFAAIVKRANEGDAGAMDELRRILDDNSCIWEQIGNMGSHAQLSLIREIAGGNKLLEESVSRMAGKLRAELLGENPSKLVEMAVERIVTSWLEMRFVETAYPMPTGATLAHQRFALKQKESAERRYEAAIRSLATVWKLLPAGNGQVDAGEVEKPADAKAKAKKPPKPAQQSAKPSNQFFPAHRFAELSPMPRGRWTLGEELPTSVN